MAQQTRYFFRRENRVRKRADFLDAYERGSRRRRAAASVFVLGRESSDQPTRLGITATRKTGGAVQRNRLKRIAREVFRAALPCMKSGSTVIVNFNPAAARMSFADIRSQLMSAWRQAELFADADVSGNRRESGS
ncbi:MAG: ribonuclease P protein component [bacterium]